MCDYSLHGQKTRPARVGDKLVVSRFPNTCTTGLREHGGDIATAVCMLPGTEVAFASEALAEPAFGSGIVPNIKIASTVARFRQINLENANAHHDALEFANGETVLINRLVRDQELTVLQLGREEVKAEPEQPTIREALVQRFAENDARRLSANAQMGTGGIPVGEAQPIGEGFNRDNSLTSTAETVS